MFKGNTKLKAFKTERNRYAEKVLVESFGESCSLISGESGVQISSVRADASASRGRSEIKIGEYIALLERETEIRPGTIVMFDGELSKHEVKSMHPLRDINGAIDHYEAVCKLWQG